MDPINIDALIRRVNDEVIARRMLRVASGGMSEASTDAADGLVSTKSEHSLDALLALEGNRFLAVAYQVVLRRAPDPEGLRYFGKQLNEGIANVKYGILRALRNSPEGRAVGVGLSFLEDPYRDCQGEDGADSAIERVNDQTIEFRPATGELPEAGTRNDRIAGRVVDMFDLSGPEFVRTIYLAALQRLPEASDMIHCLAALEAGAEKREMFETLRKAGDANASVPRADVPR